MRTSKQLYGILRLPAHDEHGVRDRTQKSKTPRLGYLSLFLWPELHAASLPLSGLRPCLLLRLLHKRPHSPAVLGSREPLGGEVSRGLSMWLGCSEIGGEPLLGLVCGGSSARSDAAAVLPPPAPRYVAQKPCW